MEELESSPGVSQSPENQALARECSHLSAGLLSSTPSMSGSRRRDFKGSSHLSWHGAPGHARLAHCTSALVPTGLPGTAGAPPLSLSEHASLGHDVCPTHKHSLPVQKPVPYLRPLYKERRILPSFFNFCCVIWTKPLPSPGLRNGCVAGETENTIGFPACCAV